MFKGSALHVMCISITFFRRSLSSHYDFSSSIALSLSLCLSAFPVWICDWESCSLIFILFLVYIYLMPNKFLCIYIHQTNAHFMCVYNVSNSIGVYQFNSIFVQIVSILFTIFLLMCFVREYREKKHNQNNHWKI